MSFKKEHLRHCLLFTFQLKKNATEAKEMICSALGENAVSYKTCKSWFQTFQHGKCNLEKSGFLKKVENKEEQQLLLLEELLCKQENLYRTETEFAQILGVTDKTISDWICKLQMIQKAGRWVPHKLTSDNKQRRCDIAVSLLSRFNRKDFLYKIVTGGEMWIFYDNPKRRKLCEASTSTEKPNIHDEKCKMLLSIWWDFKGILYYELHRPLNETNNSERYQQQLYRLNDEIELKRPFTGSETRQVILLHDNTQSHTAKTIKNVLCSLGWEILPHAAYSPDLLPSDYYLFQTVSFKCHLRTRFRTVEDVEKGIIEFINSTSPSFFRNGIYQLSKRWQKCIKVDGDYFEN